MSSRITQSVGVPVGVPSGTVVRYVETKPAPPGWLDCDGTYYEIAEYPGLHDAIGSYWDGDIESFAVPTLPNADGLKYIIKT